MIVEFAGLPRSGKSTCVDAAKDYFLRRGITTKIAGEAVRLCPFGNQYRVEIACWAANYALNAVLEASLGTVPRTLTLQDRGLFDALAFLQLLLKQDLISRDTLSCLKEYFADPRWTTRVDLVILFDVELEVVLERDLAQHIAKQLHVEDKDFKDLAGVITNRPTLEKLRDCYQEIHAELGCRFRIWPVPASRDVKAVTTQVVGRILEEYERKFGTIPLIQSSARVQEVEGS